MGKPTGSVLQKKKPTGPDVDADVQGGDPRGKKEREE